MFWRFGSFQNVTLCLHIASGGLLAAIAFRFLMAEQREDEQALETSPARTTSRKSNRSSFANICGSPREVHASAQEEVKVVTTKRRQRPSRTVPMLAKNTVIHDKYVVTGLIGAGGYGQILSGRWPRRGREVAIKVMIQQGDSPRMILEQMILRSLKGKPYFPDLYASGTYGNYMFIVMQKLGRSLSDLRKKCDGNRFDPQTALRVGLQVVDALTVLHDLGYLHRDLKPGNLCTGPTKETIRSIYVVDFGLARKFKSMKTRSRGRVSFRGTMRYVSINVHDRMDQTPCDDLISTFYTIVELSEGILPWTKIKNAVSIGHTKRTIEPEVLCQSQPPTLHEFYSSCLYQGWDPCAPNYCHLKDIIMRCLPSGVNLTETPMSYELLPEALLLMQ